MAEETHAVDVAGAAAFLGVHPQTIRRLAKKGQIPSFKVGRHWRFSKDALREWTQTHRERQRQCSILVADDEKSIRRTVGLSLEAAGYRVRTAPGGAEAIALLREELPDALVLDLAMPDVSGVAVLKDVRLRNPDLPVVVITGYPDGPLMQQALEYSPFVVLAKPVAPDKLMLTLRGLLQAKG